MKKHSENLEKTLGKFSFGLQKDKGMDAEVAVMYRNPHGRGIWLITEADRLSSGDYRLFGYCNIFCWEWGSLLLSEIEQVKTKVGLECVVFRDKHPIVSELVRRASVD